MELVKRLGNFQMFPKRFGIMPYIFLVYVSMPIFMLQAEDGLKAILGYTMIALFLVSYRQLYFAICTFRYFMPWLTIQMAIIFILTIFYNPNYMFLGFFPANFIGWYPNKNQFNIGLAMLTFVEVVPVLYYTFFSSEQFTLFYLLPFIVIMLLCPFGFRSMSKKMELEMQLEQANAKINEYIKREERVRIARDLHDTLGHTLSLITLKSQFVGRLTTLDPERAQLEAKEIEKTSRAALKQVRELVSDMRAVKVTDELKEIRNIFRAAGIDFDLQLNGEIDDIPLLTQNIISMCLKEASTNVIKHSRAKHCSINIHHSDDEVKILVKDDGVGISNQISEGNGLKGIEERLELIDGLLSVFGQKGTTVMLSIPVVQNAKKAGSVL